MTETMTLIRDAERERSVVTKKDGVPETNDEV